MMNARVHARKPNKIGGMMDARVGDVSIESPQQKSQSVMTAPAMQNARVNATPAVHVSQPVAAPVVVTEEKAPVVPVQTAPLQEALKAERSTETPQKKPYTHWWQTPEYLGEVNRRAADAEKRAEQDRKRAVRQRNAAILGDLAKLGAQMYAKAGGATRVDQFTPATEKANDKLAALRERHAAEVAAFAKERAAARQAQIADNNARMKLETSLAEADIDRKIKAKKDARDFAYKVAKDEFDAKIAEQNAESRRISANAAAGRASGGSGVNRDVFLINDDGTKEYFNHAENANNVQAAYARLPKEYRVEKAVPIRGRKVYAKDSDGKQVYDYIEDLDASLEQKRQAISDYNNRELIEEWVPDEDEIIEYVPNK